MAGTDLSGISYPNRVNDYSYYGNGCPNGWGDNGDGGSTVACSTRLNYTYDHELLMNGTYYNFTAVTSGSGATITAGNAVAPDSFCPLGWQVPYGGTGGDYYDQSKSFNYLFITTYGYESGQGAKVLSYPFSYNRPGLINGINHGSVRLYFMDSISSAYLWSNTYPYVISISNNISSQSHGPVDGRTIRFVLGISTLEKISMASA